ncbi:MAG: type II toxin-antitoxin system VapC family toxin [Candidatus Thorarchaeota archaeon]|nr:type II toxin-antitoxin system VapC family toxin [Candidatus Thorarchaeota archaeon]
MEALTSVCLDTSFLVDFLRGAHSTRTTYQRLRSEGYRLATTTITAFEVFRGVDKRGRIKHEEQAVRRLFSRLPVWTLDVKSAELGSRVYTELERTGNVIGINDCLVAAIALSNGCRKIVSNDSHFQRIPNIEMISY